MFMMKMIISKNNFINLMQNQILAMYQHTFTILGKQI